MNEQWKTTAVIAAAIVLIVFIASCTSPLKSKHCYEAAANGATVECSK